MKLDTDLSLDTGQIEILLRRSLGAAATCNRVTPLEGGMLNTVLRVDFDKEPHSAVIKVSSDHEAGFPDERVRLEHLSTVGGMRCPEVYGVGEPDDSVPYSYMVMELLPGINLQSVEMSPDQQASVDLQLAEMLLALHSHHRETYGSIRGDGAHQHWSDIALPRLVDMRSEMVGRLDPSVVSQIDSAIEAAQDVFHDEGPPTLVHGDLWKGNILGEKVGDTWRVTGFVDPGAQYADVEMELAYLQACETVGPHFFDAYAARSPLRQGFERRRLFYWLNTWMIHVWLFDEPIYREKLTEVLSRIAR